MSSATQRSAARLKILALTALPVLLVSECGGAVTFELEENLLVPRLLGDLLVVSCTHTGLVSSIVTEDRIPDSYAVGVGMMVTLGPNHHLSSVHRQRVIGQFYGGSMVRK